MTHKNSLSPHCRIQITKRLRTCQKARYLRRKITKLQEISEMCQYFDISWPGHVFSARVPPTTFMQTQPSSWDNLICFSAPKLGFMVSHFLADCVRLPRHRYRQQIMRHSITYQHFDEVSALPTSIPFLAASWLSHVVTDFSLVFFGQSLTFEKNSSKEPALAFYLHKQPGIPTLMKKLYKLVTLDPLATEMFRNLHY